MVVQDLEVVRVHDPTLGRDLVQEVVIDIDEVVLVHAADHALVHGRDPDRENVGIREALPKVVGLVDVEERAAKMIRKYQTLRRIGQILVTIRL